MLTIVPYKNYQKNVVLELCKSELLKGDHVYDPKKSFDEAKCQDIFQQLVLGMEYRK